MDFNFKVYFKSQAIKEINASVDWYEGKSKDLGQKFYTNAMMSVQILKKFPEMYAEVTPNIRKLKVNKFPYFLYYTIEKEKVIILKCKHLRTDDTQF